MCVKFQLHESYGPKNIPDKLKTPPFPHFFYSVAKLAMYLLLQRLSHQHEKYKTWKIPDYVE